MNKTTTTTQDPWSKYTHDVETKWIRFAHDANKGQKTATTAAFASFEPDGGSNEAFDTTKGVGLDDDDGA